MKTEMTGWQWHQLDNMQIICTSVHTDNHASSLSLDFLLAGCFSWCPTNSVKALKANILRSFYIVQKSVLICAVELQSARCCHELCVALHSWKRRSRVSRRNWRRKRTHLLCSWHQAVISLTAKYVNATHATAAASSTGSARGSGHGNCIGSICFRTWKFQNLFSCFGALASFVYQFCMQENLG